MYDYPFEGLIAKYMRHSPHICEEHHHIETSDMNTYQGRETQSWELFHQRICGVHRSACYYRMRFINSSYQIYE